MNTKQLRLTVIIACVIVSAGIVGIIATVTNSNNSTKTGYTQSDYVDPGSGQTVIDTEGKTPESAGRNPDIPSYIGFAELNDRGFNQNDIDKLRSFLNDYANKQIQENKEKVTEISLTKDTIQHSVNRDTGESIYTLDLTINRNTGYVATITSDGLTKTSYALYKGVDTSTPSIYTRSVDL